MSKPTKLALVIPFLILAVLAAFSRLRAEANVPDQRAEARKLMDNGNFKEALAKLREGAAA